MKKVFFAARLFLAALLSVLILAGCSNFISGSEDSEEYGSLSVSDDERAVYTDNIKSVIVTVTGFSAGGKKFEKTSGVVSISRGEGSTSVTGIPVSKNVAVMVQAYSDSAATSKIDGLVMYAKTDIASGSNTVTVNQKSSNEGSVYAQLIASGVNTHSLTSSQLSELSNAIPKHADANHSLIDAASIVTDFKASDLKDPSSYVKEAATVTVTSDNASGYTVQISDPNSIINTMTTGSVTYAVAPGSWTIYAIDSDGNVKASEGITVSAGGTSKVTVKKTDAGSGTDLTGKTVLFVKSDSAPTIWAWDATNSVNFASAAWPGDAMTAVTSDYMEEYSGWYMIDYTSKNTKNGEIHFLLNGVSNGPNDTGIKGADGTFWYDGSSITTTNPSPVTSGEEKVSITVDGVVPPDPSSGITVHAKYKCIYLWNNGSAAAHQDMTEEGNGWYFFNINATSTSLILENDHNFADKTSDLSIDKAGEYWYSSGSFYSYNPEDTTAPVLVSFTSDKSGTVSGDVTFTVSATDDKNLSKAVLTTSDGTTIGTISLSGTSSSGSCVWSTSTIQNGTYTVSCTVYDSSNNKAVSSNTITLTTKNANLPPIAVIGGAKKPACDKSVTYKATSSYDQNGGTIKSYTWTLTGSGATITSGASSDTLVVQTSKNEGDTFTLTLVVTDNDGASSDAVTLNCETVAVNANWDFRDETIYFLITTRFYDGDKTNNRYCWGDEVNLKSKTNNDPGWRGDFKGLIEKLDYIKALGFTAIWITPVVENASDLDYHGYHATDFSKVDPRYESADVDYQDLIDACHEKGLKVIQDIVLNHCSNAGEKNLLPMTVKDYSADNGEDCVPMVPDHNAKDIYGRNTYELLNKGVKAVTNENFNTYEELMNDTTLSDDVRGGYLYNARIYSMNNSLAIDNEEVGKMFHYCPSFSQWESYDVQIGTMAGDCVDLNTENPKVAEYLRNCYIKYINMGVDAFRIDTLKHISRLTMNNEFIPQFHAAAKAAGNDKFYMFGEACVKRTDIFNDNLPGISVCFYTWNQNSTTLDSSYAWKGTDDYIAGAKDNLAQCKVHFDAQSVNNQCTSTNAFLNNMEYHTPDYSKASGLNVIDFRMHHQFLNANQAYNCCLEEDQYFNDSTWNVTYVDSHDYGPNTILGVRYDQGTDAWAENLDLMFTFRGIPCVYYGSEVEFQAGKQIEPWYNGNKVPYNESGRAYYGDYLEGSVSANGTGDYNASGKVADTLNSTLCQHLMRLNQIRAAVPALRKGQYKSYGDLKFVRRYKDSTVDSVAVVSVSGGGTFSGLPNGKYIDVVSGAVQNVTNGTLTTSNSGKGSMAVYVNASLDTSITGAIGEAGPYLK